MPKDHVVTDRPNFSNYKGVGSDPKATYTMQGHIGMGHLQGLDALKEAEEFVGGPLACSKVGCIIAKKFNATTQALIEKRHLIIGSKKALLTAATGRPTKQLAPGWPALSLRQLH